MKDNKSIQDFRVLLNKVYAPGLQAMAAPNVLAGKHVMVIISSNKSSLSRVLLNQNSETGSENWVSSGNSES